MSTGAMNVDVTHLKNVRLVGWTGPEVTVEFDEKTTIGDLIKKLEEVLPANPDRTIKILKAIPCNIGGCDSVYPYWREDILLIESAMRYITGSGRKFWMLYVTV